MITKRHILKELNENKELFYKDTNSYDYPIYITKSQNKLAFGIAFDFVYITIYTFINNKIIASVAIDYRELNIDDFRICNHSIYLKDNSFDMRYLKGAF